MAAPPPEPALAAWSRRALTIPAAFVLFALLLVLAPLAMIPLGLFDLVARRRWASLRFVAALVLVAFMECAGLVVALWNWLTRGGIAADFRLQCWWTRTLFRLSSRVLGVRFEVEPVALPRDRPIILLVRHASVIDTLFPAVAVAIPHQIRLRYLLKHQLAWDPCIDVIGQRLENVFVRRGAKSAVQELALIQGVAGDLRPGLGVVVFPEGTRFSPARRKAALERLRARNDQASLARAEPLTHVLPPQPGGVLALLDGAPEADVVFLAHTGLEDARTLADLWSGRLIGRVVHATSWRVARADVPSGVRARVAWLYDQWTRMDGWIGVHAPAAAAVDEGDAPPESRYAGA